MESTYSFCDEEHQYSDCITCENSRHQEGFMDNYLVCKKTDKICWKWSDNPRPFWCPLGKDE